MDKTLTGAAAVGMGLVVWATHGGDWAQVEIAALAAGAGAAVAWAAGIFERLVAWFTSDSRESPNEESPGAE